MLLPALRTVSGKWRLQHVICCGESLLPATVSAFYDAAMSRGEHTHLHNVYGPTEASMTHHVCMHGASEVLIGEPIDNTTVHDTTRRWSVLARALRGGLRASAETAAARVCARCGFWTRRAGSRPSVPPPRFASVGSWRPATSVRPSSLRRDSCPTLSSPPTAPAAGSWPRSG